MAQACQSSGGCVVDTISIGGVGPQTWCRKVSCPKYVRKPWIEVCKAHGIPPALPHAFPKGTRPWRLYTWLLLLRVAYEMGVEPPLRHDHRSSKTALEIEHNFE